MTSEELRDIFIRFDIPEEPTSFQSVTDGHINKTFLVTTGEKQNGKRRYVLQRINTDVFVHPVELMRNIENVTGFLRKTIAENGGNPERETLTLIPSRSGEKYIVDRNGGYWRVYVFVANAVSYNTADSIELFENAAYAFGHFQKQLDSFPAEELYETIPHFHDTVSRYRDFLRAVEENRSGRREEAEPEIRFITEREAVYSYVTDRMATGEIPIRVTHNDTKLNNVLFDAGTGKALCVIDLDTVMPGTLLFDFGDGIRFGASGTAEDEKDLSLVSLKPDLFEAYVRGFLRGCGKTLTPAELTALPMGAYLITMETGMRFLTDYLNGDVYFSIARPEHNLDRARTQLRLAADMETKMDIMKEIVARYS